MALPRPHPSPPAGHRADRVRAVGLRVPDSRTQIPARGECIRNDKIVFQEKHGEATFLELFRIIMLGEHLVAFRPDPFVFNIDFPVSTDSPHTTPDLHK